MDLKAIEALAQILRGSDLTALEVREGETQIRLERTPAPVTVQTLATPAPVAAAQPVAPASQELPEPQGVDFKNLKEVKTPVVGVFYAAPTPDAEPFVTIGSKVKKGDVLCIVEAMKLMNEITAEMDGEIFDICVQDGQVVEYGQTIFKLV